MNGKKRKSFSVKRVFKSSKNPRGCDSPRRGRRLKILLKFHYDLSELSIPHIVGLRARRYTGIFGAEFMRIGNRPAAARPERTENDKLVISQFSGAGFYKCGRTSGFGRSGRQEIERMHAGRTFQTPLLPCSPPTPGNVSRRCEFVDAERTRAPDFAY